MKNRSNNTNISENFFEMKKTPENSKKPQNLNNFNNNNNEVSTSCSSRSIASNLLPSKKDDEKRALSAFSLKTSAVSEELEKINENHSDSSEKSPTQTQQIQEKKPDKKKITPIKPSAGPYKKGQPQSISLREKEPVPKQEDSKIQDYLQRKSLDSGKLEDFIEDEKSEKNEDFYKNDTFFKNGYSEKKTNKKPPLNGNTAASFNDKDIKSSNFDYTKSSYLDKEDLEPVKAPEIAYKSLMAELKSMYFLIKL